MVRLRRATVTARIKGVVKGLAQALLLVGAIAGMTMSNAGAATQHYVIEVAGMHCPLCTAMVRQALLKVDGVTAAKASLRDKMARVEVEDRVDKAQLLEAIATTGYEGVFVDETAQN